MENRPYSIINIHAKIFIEPSLCGRYTGCFLRSALLSNIKCLFNQLLIISKSALLWRIILNIFTLLQFDRWNVYMSSILNISCRCNWCWKWFKTVFVITCGDKTVSEEKMLFFSFFSFPIFHSTSACETKYVG